MRLRLTPVLTSRWLARIAITLAFCAGLSASASSQSLLDFLFGSAQPAPRPPAHHRLLPPASQTIQLPGSVDTRPRSRSRHYSGRSGTYRTLCVRLCDGYYFPINQNTRYGYLHRDADACQARCGSHGRLFYHPSGLANMRRAVDRSGLAYTSLKTAFRYRKKYDPSCTCKPHPWSASEKRRHRRYAAIEADHATGAEQPSDAETKHDGQVPPLDEGAGEPQQTSVASTSLEPLSAAAVERPEPVTFERSEPVVTQSKPTRVNRRSVRPRTTRYNKKKKKKRRTKRPSTSSSGAIPWLLGPSKPKYVWPGDPVPRRR